MPEAPERVRITDVSPRDGLQNERGVIPTHDKAELIRRLAAAGVDEVEVTSFVNPAWVPQLADAAALLELIAQGDSTRLPRAVLSALVPNERGLRGVLTANAAAGRMLISKVAVFTAASETFSRKNTNATISETIERFRPVLTLAHAEGLQVRGYVSCILRCPYEGDIAAEAVADVVMRLIDIGVDEVDLGDTIGAAEPATLGRLLNALNDMTPLLYTRFPLTLHLHDTFGRAAACLGVALDAGIRSFDGSVAGLGGCPFAGVKERPAPGNISTELLVRTVHCAGYATGVNEPALEHAGEYARTIVSAARSSEQTAAAAGLRA